MDGKLNASASWLLWILLVSVAIVLGQSMYKNYLLKNYLMYVEAECDSAISECYVRDCSEGDCPPNNLSSYRAFELPASQFHNCSDNSCLNICPSSTYLCTEIPCSMQSDVECEGPAATTAQSP